MVKGKESGIPAIHEWILRKESREKLIKAHTDLNVEHGKKVLADLDAKRARNEGKAIGIAPAKEKARAVYAEMKEKLGKNPSFKQFEKELTYRYPIEPWPGRKRKGEKVGREPSKAVAPWVEDTINGWWKRMNAGKTF